MASNYETTIKVQNSIYGENSKGQDRDLKIHFSLPEKDVNEETGILLVISGFLGNTHSKVFKKMRGQFADKHNMIILEANLCKMILKLSHLNFHQILNKLIQKQNKS